MTLQRQFESLTATDVQAYVNAQQEENVQLEFKTANSNDFSNRDDRKNLAKALSGFGNSSGGLLVWGVNAGKNANDIDCAIATIEIPQIQLFLTRLNALTGQAVSPIIDGVSHKTLDTNGGAGFAITLVPESDSGPHMAKCGEDRYYKRSGDSFYRMEHFDLEDMFGRRQKPELEVTTRLQSRAADTKIIVGIKNIGRGTARAPYLAFNVTEPFRPSNWGLDGNRTHGLPKLHDGQVLKHRFGSMGGLVIHPGTAHEVTSLELPGLNPRPEMLPDVDIQLEYEISAEDIRSVTGSINLGRIPHQ